MIIDFHVHGKIRSGFPFIEENFLKYLAKAEDTKINYLALTEHCHATSFHQVYQYLDQNYQYANGTYKIGNIKVFIGMEVSTSIGLDILFIGHKNEIINLRNKVIANKKDYEHIDINLLFNLDDFDNMVVILAHPFRNHKKTPELSEIILSKIDATEYNASDLHNFGINNMTKKVKALADKLKLPIVGGSDSHYFFQMGSIKTIFEEEMFLIKEIKEAIKAENFKVEISPNLDLKVKSGKIIKKPLIGEE